MAGAPGIATHDSSRALAANFGMPTTINFSFEIRNIPLTGEMEPPKLRESNS